MQQFTDLDLWLQKAAALLEGNRITLDGHSYTAPSLDTVDFGRKDYANQYLWDSCFHAVIWRWIDPLKAQAELLSLVSRQVEEGPDAGMIPHCNYWRNEGAWLWRQPERSSLTHPPLIAVAAALVFEAHSEDAARLLLDEARIADGELPADPRAFSARLSRMIGSAIK